MSHPYAECDFCSTPCNSLGYAGGFCGLMATNVDRAIALNVCIYMDEAFCSADCCFATERMLVLTAVADWQG